MRGGCAEKMIQTFSLLVCLTIVLGGCSDGPLSRTVNVSGLWEVRIRVDRDPCDIGVADAVDTLAVIQEGTTLTIEDFSGTIDPSDGSFEVSISERDDLFGLQGNWTGRFSSETKFSGQLVYLVIFLDQSLAKEYGTSSCEVRGNTQGKRV